MGAATLMPLALDRTLLNPAPAAAVPFGLPKSQPDVDDPFLSVPPQAEDSPLLQEGQSQQHTDTLHVEELATDHARELEVGGGCTVEPYSREFRPPAATPGVGSGWGYVAGGGEPSSLTEQGSVGAPQGKSRYKLKAPAPVRVPSRLPQVTHTALLSLSTSLPSRPLTALQPAHLAASRPPGGSSSLSGSPPCVSPGVTCPSTLLGGPCTPLIRQHAPGASRVRQTPRSTVATSAPGTALSHHGSKSPPPWASVSLHPLPDRWSPSISQRRHLSPHTPCGPCSPAPGSSPSCSPSGTSTLQGLHSPHFPGLATNWSPRPTPASRGASAASPRLLPSPDFSFSTNAAAFSWGSPPVISGHAGASAMDFLLSSSNVQACRPVPSSHQQKAMPGNFTATGCPLICIPNPRAGRSTRAPLEAPTPPSCSPTAEDEGFCFRPFLSPQPLRRRSLEQDPQEFKLGLGPRSLRSGEPACVGILDLACGPLIVGKPLRLKSCLKKPGLERSRRAKQVRFAPTVKVRKFFARD